MTKPLPFTESAVRRAVNAARKAGLQVNAVSIAPDGTITIHQQGIAQLVAPIHNEAPSRSEWEDIQA